MIRNGKENSTIPIREPQLLQPTVVALPPAPNPRLNLLSEMHCQSLHFPPPAQEQQTATYNCSVCPTKNRRYKGSSRNVFADRKDENKEAKPSSLLFTWNMKTTSSMDIGDMMWEICKVPGANNCDYVQREGFSALLHPWQWVHRERGTVGEGGVYAAETVFERVWFKQILEKSISFKNIASKIANEIKL
ncbi:MAP/microtubule affinity-regulating kinase 3 [Sciurus carolinensis]|uniref:MAP/microtubule affinity-regulating kinase 3 n=1 Tax=Sciurus carolinensis TaxID=30640 RepID=A0AA41T3I9_SCICA|nr:MAP/microtubule affinity-regulating kinase 3 [Sciurus carolinensis]